MQGASFVTGTCRTQREVHSFSAEKSGAMRPYRPIARHGQRRICATLGLIYDHPRMTLNGAVESISEAEKNTRLGTTRIAPTEDDRMDPKYSNIFWHQGIKIFEEAFFETRGAAPRGTRGE